MDAVYKDTETGGLFPSIHALLSIGACCSWGGVPFHAYILPESQKGKTVEPEAAAKNGYTPERWRSLGARFLADVMPEYMAWVEARKKERPDAVFVCHHLAFDKPFLAEAARSCGLGDLPHRNDWRCSQVLFGELMDRGLIERGSSSLNRLKELSEWKGDRPDEHNAMIDAMITRHGHQWLLEKGRSCERTLSELAARRLKDIHFLDNGMRQISVWFENGTAEGRPLQHMLEEMTCLAKSFYDEDPTGAEVKAVSGARRIMMERFRQITAEGWTAEGDDQYVNGELRDAGIAYSMACDDRAAEGARGVWPWDETFWKPSEDPIRNLEKAGALFSAEIDRLLRKEGR